MDRQEMKQQTMTIPPHPSGEVPATLPEGGQLSHFLTMAVQALQRAMHDPAPPPALTAEFQGCPALEHLYHELLTVRASILALVKGDLSQELTLKGYLAGALKALQANLRHLTWQTQMIATGDFSQRVDFMGEFSEAFNAMVVQLEEQRQQLQEKQASLLRLNEELRAEIARRQEVEASLRESEAAYRELAIADPLTGIYNRRYFFQRAQEEVHRAQRYRHPLTVVIYDLDFFKQINDKFGHAAGDKVLQATARLVSSSIRASDLFARYGGEEFILLLPETNAAGGREVAERLRQAIASQPVPHDPEPLAITISAGVACLAPAANSVGPSASTTLDELIKQADQALYEAKKAGRNRVHVWTEQT